MNEIQTNEVVEVQQEPVLPSDIYIYITADSEECQQQIDIVNEANLGFDVTYITVENTPEAFQEAGLNKVPTIEVRKGSQMVCSTIGPIEADRINSLKIYT